MMLLKLVTIRLSWNRTAGIFFNLFAEIVRFTSQKSFDTFDYDLDDERSEESILPARQFPLCEPLGLRLGEVRRDCHHADHDEA